MIDLATDIKSILKAQALGRANAMPRRVLQNELKKLGRTVSDRALLNGCAECPGVGYTTDDGERLGQCWAMSPDEETRQGADTATQGELF